MLVFVDCETASLKPYVTLGEDEYAGSVWEVAAVVESPEGPREYLWQVVPGMDRAEEEALEVGRFRERCLVAGRERGAAVCLMCPDKGDCAHEVSARSVAEMVAELVKGAIVVGSNPVFDRDHLRLFLGWYGLEWGAHYRLVDTATLAAGRLAGSVVGSEPRYTALSWPWSSRDLSRGVGVDPDGFERHSALGDARWCRAQWRAVMGARSW